MKGAYHAPDPVSLYCVLLSLDSDDMFSLLRRKRAYVLPFCNYGICSD